MNAVKHYTHCPVCGSSLIVPVFPARDNTVSGEQFGIMQCDDCSLRFTQDVPEQNSIARYYKSENYISHTNVSKGLINRIYQVVRKKTLKQKRKLVEKVSGKSGGTLLDIGSGTGAFVKEMKDNGWTVTGLEPDDDAIAAARKYFNTELKSTDQLFTLSPGSCDVITLWHVLEHVHQLHQYIDQFKKILKDDGRLIIAVPNYNSKDARLYQQYWAGYDVPRHLYHFSALSMRTLMEKHGMTIIDHKPMWFDSFYVSLLSSKYKNGQTNWLAALWNGLRSNLSAMKDVRVCSSVIYVVRKRVG